MGLILAFGTKLFSSSRLVTFSCVRVAAESAVTLIGISCGLSVNRRAVTSTCSRFRPLPSLLSPADSPLRAVAPNASQTTASPSVRLLLRAMRLI